jgi:hypothetical protein
MTNFGLSSILVRALLVFGVLFAIYNPSEYSYFHWIFSGFDDSGVGYGLVMVMLKIAVGLFLAIVLLTFASIIYHGVGVIGGAILLMLTIPLTIVIGYYLMATWGLPTVILTGLGMFTTMGLIYSNLRYRLSAQVQPASTNPQNPGL